MDDALRAAERVSSMVRASLARGRTRVAIAAALRDLARAAYDDAARSAYGSADVVFPGSPSAARLAGRLPPPCAPVREVVRAGDLVWALAGASAREGLGLFFLGGRPGFAARAALAVERGVPGARVVGTLFPGPLATDDDDARVLAVVRASRADVLIADLDSHDPAPWTTERAPRLGVPVAVAARGAMAMTLGRDDPPPWTAQVVETAALIALTARSLLAAPSPVPGLQPG